MPALEYYQYILNSVPCGICQVALDEELTLLYANRYYYQIYGYTQQTAEEEGFQNARYILPEKEYSKILAKIFRHIRQGDRYFQLEYRGSHRTGKIMWLLVQCFYDQDRPGSMLCVLVDIADRKHMEEELRISMEESRIAFQLTDKLMYVFDVAKRRLCQPADVADEFGLPYVLDNVPYSVVESGAIDEESREDYINFYESIMRGEPNGYTAVKKKKKDGTFGWYAAKYSLICDREGGPRRAIIACENITEQREKELAYQKWSQYFKSQEGQAIGYYEYNLTKDIKEEGVGDTPPDYLKPLKKYTQTVRYIAEHFVYEADRDRFYDFFYRDKLLSRFYDGQREGTIEYLRIREDGSLYWVRATVQMIADPYNNDVKMFMMTLDIDKEKQEELRLRNKMEHDGMTGILNREAFTARVTDILEQKNGGERHALIMLDIDLFKLHNDSYGHQFGDLVIRETAQLLKGFLRRSDLCGRMGGDEFMVFLSDIASEEDVIPRIDKLCHILQREYPEKNKVSCSLGVVFYPRDGVTFQELYRNADTALYEVKRRGRANYMVFRQEMTGPEPE